MSSENIFRRAYGRIAQLGNLTPIALTTTFLPILGGTVLLIFALPLGEWLRANQEIGLPVYLFAVLILCGLAILATNIIGTLGGWSFGFESGIAVLMAGIVGAALVSFLIHSRLVGDQLPKLLAANPKAQAIYKALVGQSVWRTTLIIFLLRLSPAMPFALTNFLMSSARVPLKSFLIGTFFGMLPRSSAVVFVGAGLSELTFDKPQNFWLLVIGIAATFVTIIIIGSVSRRALERLTNENQPA
jgi:uncharacterized membrane protein YdjX (TVP38/TMEM64 family)